MDRTPLWYDFAAVAFGGACGSMLRYMTSVLFARFGDLQQAHWGTLLVNLIGCLGIGLLVGFASSGHPLPPRIELLIRVGVFGGLTTFSSFGLELFVLASASRWRVALIYLLANVLGGLFMVALGYWVIARR